LALTEMVSIAAVMHARATLRIEFIYPPPRRTHVLRGKAESFATTQSKVAANVGTRRVEEN
jgi:hypothetical protein